MEQKLDLIEKIEKEMERRGERKEGRKKCWMLNVSISITVHVFPTFHFVVFSVFRCQFWLEICCWVNFFYFSFIFKCHLVKRRKSFTMKLSRNIFLLMYDVNSSCSCSFNFNFPLTLSIKDFVAMMLPLSKIHKEFNQFLLLSLYISL
jgi:hypothetical protein